MEVESPEYLQPCLHQAASCRAESVWAEENNGLQLKKKKKKTKLLPWEFIQLRSRKSPFHCSALLLKVTL